MKSLKPIILSMITAVALTAGGAAMAKGSTTVTSDGFLELNVVEVPQGQSAQKAPKRAVKAKQVKRTKRASSKKRVVKKSYASVYRVRSGDTLTNIAKKFHVSVDRLARLNKLRGSQINHLEVGQRLRLR